MVGVSTDPSAAQIPGGMAESLEKSGEISISKRNQ